MASTSRDDLRVIVGVDNSDSARRAALWAAELASRWDAPLHLVTVVNRSGVMSTPAPEWLRELAAAAERAGVTRTTTEVLFGAVTHQLVSQARGARLIVLGSYGGDGWSGMLAGPTALPMIASACGPMVVVRGHHPGVSPPRGGPVVVGLDGTETSEAALRFAADLAAHSEHRRLVAVHTWSDVVRGLDGHSRASTEDPLELERRAESTLDEQLAPITARYPGLQIERHVLADTPLRALIEHAEKAWLVVVGQRATTPNSGPLFGSTSRGLVEFAPCPVAVIPAEPASATPEEGC